MAETVKLDPAVEAFVDALNAQDTDRFYGVLAEDATMSDDGVERNLAQWTEAEIFSANGHLEVDTVEADGLEFTADYTNSRWGSMRTTWRFDVRNGLISRFETGQA
ncbi:MULTISPECIES: nuclear transport factor 2 family protein [Nocardia]|uniref:nuclear transport factor 2 family protein n=1 Tax=Nocardia TaxID=1817 RepID=UPI0015EED831|nr:MULTISPECIES: nuclear transport factor 2 family protein [Nocardia]MCA2208042.1 nuclear transport factor 2 family protein [Nocardia rosealba]